MHINEFHTIQFIGVYVSGNWRQEATTEISNDDYD